jgi:hypothetical protein
VIHSRICVCGLDSGLKPLRGLDGGNGLFIEKRYRLEIRLSITLPLSQIMRPQLRQSQKAKPQRKAVPSPRKVRDLKGLQEKIQAQFKWEDPPHDFQTEAIKAQLMRKDVLVHAGTGAGKTAIAAGPHAHEACKGGVSFMVSPLIALQQEQVSLECATMSRNDLRIIAYHVVLKRLICLKLSTV